MTTVRQALARLQSAADDGELAALCQRFHIVLFVVFGSAIHEGAQPKDLDVAVLFEHRAPQELVRVVTELAHLTRCDDVDVMTLNRADPVAKDQALSYGIPLYEAEPNIYGERQAAAACERMDTEWLRQLDLQLMAEGFVTR